jgi:hypothetical protein
MSYLLSRLGRPWLLVIATGATFTFALLPLTTLAAPASAAPPPPGCARIPILGLNPQIMKICDEPMNPDGSWVRGRQFTQPQFVGSTCDPAYQYRNSNGVLMCPPWAVDRTQAAEGPVDTYVLTADTVPPGEPGYIGG